MKNKIVRFIKIFIRIINIISIIIVVLSSIMVLINEPHSLIDILGALLTSILCIVLLKIFIWAWSD